MALQVRSPSAQTRIFQFTHNANMTALVPIVSGGRVFIPLNTVLANSPNSFVYWGEISGMPKTTAEAWAVGALLYFNAGTGALTTTVGANAKAGYCLEAIAAGPVIGGLVNFDSFAA